MQRCVLLDEIAVLGCGGYCSTSFPWENPFEVSIAPRRYYNLTPSTTPTMDVDDARMDLDGLLPVEFRRGEGTLRAKQAKPQMLESSERAEDSRHLAAMPMVSVHFCMSHKVQTADLGCIRLLAERNDLIDKAATYDRIEDTHEATAGRAARCECCLRT